jgi:hypothetical protein
VNHFAGATQEEKDAVELVAAHTGAFENGIGKDFRDRNNRFYRQYRRFTRFRNDLLAVSEPDRDEVITEAKQHWGAQLHIPLSFRTIETKVPRAIAQRPRMLVLPRHERWQDNVANMRMLIDAQQDQINIDLPFQAVMRSGMIYGLGVGKTFWRKEYAQQRAVKRRTLGSRAAASTCSATCRAGASSMTRTSRTSTSSTSCGTRTAPTYGPARGCCTGHGSICAAALTA